MAVRRPTTPGGGGAVVRVGGNGVMDDGLGFRSDAAWQVRTSMSRKKAIRGSQGLVSEMARRYEGHR